MTADLSVPITADLPDSLRQELDPRSSHDVLSQLQALAREFDGIGADSTTFAEGDRWHRDAAQLRLVAHLVESTPAKWLVMGQQWLSAGRAQLRARSMS